MPEINNKISQEVIDYQGNRCYQNVEESPDKSAESSGRVSRLFMLSMALVALSPLVGIAIGSHYHKEANSVPQYQQRLPEAEAKR